MEVAAGKPVECSDLKNVLKKAGSGTVGCERKIDEAKKMAIFAIEFRTLVVPEDSRKKIDARVVVDGVSGNSLVASKLTQPQDKPLTGTFTISFGNVSSEFQYNTSVSEIEKKLNEDNKSTFNNRLIVEGETGMVRVNLYFIFQ
jgi:hypothetical protein